MGEGKRGTEMRPEHVPPLSLLQYLHWCPGSVEVVNDRQEVEAQQSTSQGPGLSKVDSLARASSSPNSSWHY